MAGVEDLTVNTKSGKFGEGKGGELPCKNIITEFTYKKINLLLK
jgi:hypothetical protein